VSSLIQPSHINAALAATSKRAVLAEMAAMFTALDQEAVQAALLERETVGSTAIEPGIAIPHAKLTVASEIEVCFGRSQAGIQWGAPDHQLVHLIFMMVAPVQASQKYLQVLATLCRFLRHRNNRSLLQSAAAEELVTFLVAAKELQ